jgi:uncharacterized protein
MSEPILIRTYTGKIVNILDVKVEDVDIEDIAHSMSNICRYTGHSIYFYPDALHSVYVSRKCDKKYKMHGLLHDASGCFLGDMHGPLKHSPAMKWYCKTEKEKIMPVIAQAFGIEYTKEVDIHVKERDNRVFATEVGQVMTCPWPVEYVPYPDLKIKALSPLKAKQVFLTEFYKLKGELNA